MNKNMKRVLSLVLAFVMMIGMMVPSFAEEAPKVDKTKFQMMIVDDFDNVVGKNPKTLVGDPVVEVATRTAGSAGNYGTAAALTANDLGAFVIEKLAPSTDYKIDINISNIKIVSKGASAYSFGMDNQKPAQPIYTDSITFSTDEFGNITNDKFVGMYTMSVVSHGGANFFNPYIEKYYVQVKDVNNVPVQNVPVKLYKADWNEDTLRFEPMMDSTDPVADLGNTNDNGQVAINVLLRDNGELQVFNEDTTPVQENGNPVRFENGQLFMAVVENVQNHSVSVAPVTVPGMEGLLGSNVLVDLWQYNGKVRVFDNTTGQDIKLVKENAVDNKLTLKSEPRQLEIVLQEKPVNIVVKVFNNGVTPGIRKPVAGAEIALYDVIAPEIPGSKVKDSDFAEKAKATTDKYGHAVFENVDMSSMVSYWTDTLGTKPVKVPYAIKQLSAPEGLTPYKGYIMMDGYFENVNPNKENQSLVVSRTLDGNNLIIEIENHADAFNYEGRIFGKDRYATAVEIAKKAFPDGLKPADTNFNRKTVVLAQGHQFSDSLVAGPVAEMSKAPILLTAKNSVPAVTLEYLVANGVEQVIIMGGSNTVSDAVLATLNKAVADGGAGVQHIVRIEGSNRYATAVEAGNYLLKAVRDNNVANSRFDWGFTPNNKTGSIVFVANGLNFADALTASVPAAAYGAPILLTDGNKLPAETAQALRDWKIVNAYVIGGEKSVSANEFAEIAKVSTAKRVAGVNRTDTSLQVAEKFIDNASHAYFANGMKAADALTGVVLGVKDRAPIILVSGDKVSESVADYINNSQLTSGTILGGPNSISTQLRDALSKQINLKK